jgi:hypothetical protein
MASTLLLFSQWLLARSSYHAMSRTVYKNTSNTPPTHATHSKRFNLSPSKQINRYETAAHSKSIQRQELEDPTDEFYPRWNTRSSKSGLANFNQKEGHINSLMTPLRATCVYTYIAK